MFLVWRELRRAKIRFAVLIGAIALLTFLILFQQGLQQALVRTIVGGTRASSAEVLVFNVDGRRFAQASSVSDEDRTRIAALDEVAATARIGQTTLPATIRSSDNPVPVAVVGYDDQTLGAPRTLERGRYPNAPGETVATAENAARGFAIGDTIQIPPGGARFVVVGLAASADNINPSLYVSWNDYVELLRTRNPALEEPPANVVAVRPAAGVTARSVVSAINALSDDLDALTRDDAARRSPAVASINQTFSAIFVLFALVVPLVCGLFLLISTQQKTASLTLLRATGIDTRRLTRAVVVQAAIVLAAGIGIGIAAYLPLDGAYLDPFTLQVHARDVVLWAVVLGGLGLLSARGSIRRVKRIDPIAATTGTDLR